MMTDGVTIPMPKTKQLTLLNSDLISYNEELNIEELRMQDEEKTVETLKTLVFPQLDTLKYTTGTLNKLENSEYPSEIAQAILYHLGEIERDIAEISRKHKKTEVAMEVKKLSSNDSAFGI